VDCNTAITVIAIRIICIVPLIIVVEDLENIRFSKTRKLEINRSLHRGKCVL